MMYDAIPQPVPIQIPNPPGAPLNFTSVNAGTLANCVYTTAWGAVDHFVGGHGQGHVAVPHESVSTGALLSCAAVIYIYTGPAGVLNTALYHAHTGAILPAHLPNAGVYNVNGVALGNIHVVFASSQPAGGPPAQNITTAASGLVALVNLGILQANIRVLTETTGGFGCNSQGDVGRMAAHQYRTTPDTDQLIRDALRDTWGDYRAQFPAGATTLGFMGSGHNLADGRARLLELTNQLGRATHDSQRVSAVEAFLAVANRSYKNGSVKLFFVRRLVQQFGVIPPPAVTAANAATVAANLFADIRAGNL